MPTLLEYECPSCGGAVAFDAQLQKMKCPYCDSIFELDQLKAKEETNKEPQMKEEPDWSEEVNTYVCQSCGGEILSDANTVATSCPYCASPVVMSSRVEGILRPDLVIPFKLDKKAAMEALKKHTSGKILLPKCFKSENRIEKIQGVYVPFWLYDATAQGDVSYRATKVRHWSDANYNYTNTRHYAVHRAGQIAFEAVPVDGSEKMADDLMESIEPYDLSQAVDFETAYLAGYLADKYDLDQASTKERAFERIRVSTRDALRNTVEGYDTVNEEGADVQIEEGCVRYALLPVWMLSTMYKGKNYIFAMNGQTGKMVGDLPMNKTAFWLWLLGVSTVATAVAYMISLLL